MGRFVEGKWITEQEWADRDGEFRRQPTTFRGTIDAGGPHPPEAGRYHLYVSYACPWAHRTLIVRKLKGLEDAIGVSVVSPDMGEDGWTFEDFPGVIPDDVNGVQQLKELYLKADPTFTGRVTVPVLWDKKTGGIVNNESAEIIRMLNGPMSVLSATREQAALDLYPEELRSEIDTINERVYDTVNNGVYKAGFAGTQAAYERHVKALFESLDWLEGLLGERRYLAKDRITEADWRLFTTLVRFDAVYVTHFKCNLRRIHDYPNLSGYLRELYQWPGVRETVNLEHIKRHYFFSHRSLNPRGIVPLGPELDLEAPHGRG